MSHSEGNAKGTNCNIAHSFQSGRFHREEGQRVSWLEGAGSVYEAGIGATPPCHGFYKTRDFGGIA